MERQLAAGAVTILPAGMMPCEKVAGDHVDAILETHEFDEDLAVMAQILDVDPGIGKVDGGTSGRSRHAVYRAAITATVIFDSDHFDVGVPKCRKKDSLVSLQDSILCLDACLVLGFPVADRGLAFFGKFYGSSGHDDVSRS